MKTFKLSIKLSLIVVCALAGFVLFGTIFKLTLDTLKIRGPLYQEIIEGKDLLADILPPPAYIIESYLVVLQAGVTSDKAALRSLEERFNQLHKEFEERSAYWIKEYKDGPIKNTLTSEVYPPAKEFYDIASRRYFPAVLARDRTRAHELASGIMREKYEAHRAAIDKLAKLQGDDYEMDVKDADEISRSRMMYLLFISGTIIVTIGLISYFIAISITKPVAAVNAVAKHAAEGDLSREVRITTSDEIGDMSQSFNRMIAKIREMIDRMNASTGTLATSSEELSATSEDMSKGVRELSTQAEQVATAMTEVSQTIMDMAKNASQAADASRSASETAAQGKQIVDTTAEDMTRIAKTVQDAAVTIEELGKSSAQIGEIVAVINSIADQTNLLALNAAIEAARAGEQGRGFAVVADEVRKLAERTSQATKDISQRIEGIQRAASESVDAMRKGSDEVDKGVALARDASASMDAIVTASTNAMDMVQRIAAATEEQSAATEQVTQNMDNISNIAKSSSSATEQIKVSAEELARLSAELKSMAAWFRLSGATSQQALVPARTTVPESTKSEKANRVLQEA